MSYKGKFRPTNRTKYKGDPDNIIYRSLWERQVMKDLDLNVNVVEWASEEIVIPYRSPIDGKMHRYFPSRFNFSSGLMTLAKLPALATPSEISG